MKKLLIALLITSYLIPVTGNAQTPYVAIPDSNFVHYLKTIVPTAFKGDSLNKNSTLVTTYTNGINCPSMSIANLSGVQYFTSLTDLNCYQNSLTTLPTLPNSLQLLWCSSNLLTSLPVLPNTLTHLACETNSLTTLPALTNTLTYLDCGQNNIACFPTFPSSITIISIDPNPYNCLPNYISAMSAADLATPLCAAGNSNGCPFAVAGIEQYNINNEVQVYPNPAKDIINVNGLLINEETHIQLIDMFGNFVGEYITSDKATDIDVSGLSEGVYDILIQNSEVKINKKVVIVK